MTRYEKTLTEANAQCHKLFQDALNSWLDPRHIEREPHNQDEEAIEEFCDGDRQ